MFTKELADGRGTAQVTRKDGTWHVTINGQPYTTGSLRQLPEPKGPATHVIGVTKVIGFTPGEAGELQAILDAERAAYAASPAGRRASLTRALNIAIDTATDLREQAANTGEGWPKIGSAEQQINAAQAALDAFDAEHPEFRAAEEAVEEARVQESVRAAFNS